MDLKKCPRPVQNLAFFNSILTNLEHVPEHVLKHSKVPARKQSISCGDRNMHMALCAAWSIQTLVWTSAENRSGTVRPAYSGEFLAHCETRAKSSRSGRMVAVLLVREKIHKHLSAVWVPALVPDYAPRSWRIKCKCVHVGIKYINASQNNSYKKTCFADIKHTCIPHQIRILTVCWRHQRCFRYPSIHSNIENRRQVLFEHWICLKSTNQKKIDNPKSGW